MLAAYQRLPEFASDLSNMAQPRLKGAKVVLLEGCFDTSTAVVPCHNDVLHFQMLNRILDDSEQIDVRWRGYVGDISVHEHLAWFETHNLIGGDSGIRASNPQVLWNLQFDELGEEFWFILCARLSPISVVLHDFVKVRH